MIIELKGQGLEMDDPVIAEGALHFVTFRVKCDKAWKKRNITLRFYHLESEESADVPDVMEGKSYYFPEGLLKKGVLEISAVGVERDGAVVTTEKKEIEIKGSVLGGSTPSVTKDAYAEYVNDVLYHRRKCEKAEKAVLDALKRCEKAERSMEEMYSACQKSERQCLEILEKVSGALDAVGLSIRDVRVAESNLFSCESDLRKREEKRESTEKLRRIEERERERSEEIRRESERERDLSEKGRVLSEKARAIAECERNERLRDLDVRLSSLEEKKKDFPLYVENYPFEEHLSFDAPESVAKIRIFGVSTACDGGEKSVAEGGYLELKLDGREERAEVGYPLRGIGDISDELVLERDKAYVIRRIVKVTFTGDEDITEEETEDGKRIYILPLPYGTFVSDEGGGLSTCFDFDVSGSHVCLTVPKEEYPDKSALSEKLRSLESQGKPFSIILPLAKEIIEDVSFCYLPESIGKIETGESCVGVVSVERNLFETIEKLKENIEKIKKEKII